MPYDLSAVLVDSGPVPKDQFQATWQAVQKALLWLEPAFLVCSLLLLLLFITITITITIAIAYYYYYY